MNQMNLFDQSRKDYTPSYHNTLPVKGEELKQREQRANNQDGLVINLFMITPPHQFTATEVFRMLEKQGHKIIRDSVKRSITNLKNAKYLEKTEGRKMGEYGSTESIYKLIK